jgi:hypothetical protein
MSHSYLLFFHLCLCFDVLDDESTVKYNLFYFLVFSLQEAMKTTFIVRSNSSYGKYNKLILQIERLTIIHNFKHGIRPGTYLIEILLPVFLWNYIVLLFWLLLLLWIVYLRWHSAVICSYNAAYFLCSPCDSKIKRFNIGRAEYVQIDIRTHTLLCIYI